MSLSDPAIADVLLSSGLGRLLDIADEKIDEADLTIAKEKTKGLMRIAKTGLARMAAGGNVNQNNTLRQRAQRLQGAARAAPNGSLPSQQANLPPAYTSALPPNLPGQEVAPNPANPGLALQNPYAYMNPYAMAGAFAARFYGQPAYHGQATSHAQTYNVLPGPAHAQGSLLTDTAHSDSSNNVSQPITTPAPGRPQYAYPAAPLQASVHQMPAHGIPQQLGSFWPGAVMANPLLQAGAGLYRRSVGKAAQ
jgi:hypothetical protein